jgi:hypothetical protein
VSQYKLFLGARRAAIAKRLNEYLGEPPSPLAG